MNIYWGDLHNHCGITYGYGNLENALKVAKEQLDFCAVIGHAMWPDIPERTLETEYLVDFHKEGFQKLKDNWDRVRNVVANANKPHEFVTFQGYEIHSNQYGDHHILSTSDILPLVEAESPKELVKKLAPHPVIAVPHHIGYSPGYRGINWNLFTPEISPIVEVFSKHGSSMRENGPYPYYHTMGPRDSRNTVEAGMERGFRFGFVGSTDHHAGYPGSYGDGRVAVLARENTREAIWEALLARRVYAITGDKIKCDFSINGAVMGSEIKSNDGNRQIKLDVETCDELDKVVVYKNLKPWKVVNGETLSGQGNDRSTYKVRIETGWGNEVDGFQWQNELSVIDGEIQSVETCFRGRNILAPSKDKRDSSDLNNLDNRIVEQSSQGVSWNCVTFKNPTTQHAHTAAIIVELKGSENTTFQLNLNGKEIELSLGDLLVGSWSTHLQPYHSEALLVHRAIPREGYYFNFTWEDNEEESDCDSYHVEIRQKNNQYAWISPIFVK